jgi:hypothetical protein
MLDSMDSGCNCRSSGWCAPIPLMPAEEPAAALRHHLRLCGACTRSDSTRSTPGCGLGPAWLLLQGLRAAGHAALGAGAGCLAAPGAQQPRLHPHPRARVHVRHPVGRLQRQQGRGGQLPGGWVRCRRRSKRARCRLRTGASLLAVTGVKGGRQW